MDLTVFGKENRDYIADIIIVQIVGSVNMDDSRWLYPWLSVSSTYSQQVRVKMLIAKSIISHWRRRGGGNPINSKIVIAFSGKLQTTCP